MSYTDPLQLDLSDRLEDYVNGQNSQPLIGLPPKTDREVHDEIYDFDMVANNLEDHLDDITGDIPDLTIREKLTMFNEKVGSYLSGFTTIMKWAIVGMVAFAAIYFMSFLPKR